MRKGVSFLVTMAILALASSLASAYDPSLLRDFCIAINNIKSGVFVNGIFFKDSAQVIVNDFFFSGLNILENTRNKDGSNVTLVNGDVFGFSIGLIHSQINIGETAALAFASFNSQNPGLITIANAVFGSNPPINPNVLIKAFQLDKGVVEYLQKAFAPNVGKNWFCISYKTHGRSNK
ncbi:hypothetical protein ACB098_05G107100 [Castanea mollissima]